ARELPHDDVQMFYAESWALAHMLAFSAEYGPRFAGFLKALSSGASTEQALQTAYAKMLDDAARDLSSWVARGSFQASSFAGVAPPQVAVVNEVSAFEQRRLIADLLFVSGALSRAQALYRQLQRDAPADSDVAIALGEISLRQADKAQALREWKPAIARGARDAKLCYRYALVAQQTGVPDVEIIPVLERTVALDPAF